MRRNDTEAYFPNNRKKTLVFLTTPAAVIKSTIILFIRHEITNRGRYTRQQFSETIKRRPDSSEYMSSRIHAEDDTPFPTYSNILFFIALLNREAGGKIASCVIFDIKSELNFVMRYSFFKVQWLATSTYFSRWYFSSKVQLLCLYVPCFRC